MAGYLFVLPTGFEPASATFGGWCSSIELRQLVGPFSDQAADESLGLSTAARGSGTHTSCRQQDSNLHPSLRRALFSPLNYGN